MKSAILVETSKPLLIDDVKFDDNLSFGQVLVKVLYSGICGSQINEIDASKGPDLFLPHLLGHEGSGIVKDIGPGVKSVKPGDHVVLHWRKGQGIESDYPKYFWKNKKLNAGLVTTFNEEAIVSENRITKISKDTDLKSAALFGCAVLTGFGVVNNDAKIKIGQSVLIFGIGGVGLNIAQAASMVSAYPIIGVDLNEFKLNLGKKFGLTHTLKNSKKDNLKELLNSNFKNEKFDHVIDTTGIKEVIEASYDLTSNNGTTVLVGVPKEKVSIYTLPIHFDKTLTGSHGGSSFPTEDIPNYIKLLNNDKMNIKNLITHEFSLDEINKAIDLFRSGDCGRIIVRMQDG